jgi:hypothetical protein
LGGLLAGSAGAGDATFPALTRLLADHEGQVRVKPSSNRATASQTVSDMSTKFVRGGAAALLSG